MATPPGNSTCPQPPPSNAIFSILSMSLGIVSNIGALFILVNAYLLRRLHSKSCFLLLATFLVVTDFTGHVLLGTLVVKKYSSDDRSSEDVNMPEFMCQFMGGSMVFFGLCPLFAGCTMAVERCIGVTKPLLHSYIVTKRRTTICICGILLLALCVAMLPVFKLGSYSQQKPRTWCFINVLHNTTVADVVFVTVFSGLGLASLCLTLVFNTICGITLVRARLWRQAFLYHSPHSHDIEMLLQLVGIMLTSSICWAPLLIFTLNKVIWSYTKPVGEEFDSCDQIVSYVRLAGLNQILDPWVYILLRRGVLKKICRVANYHKRLRGSMLGHWEQNPVPTNTQVNQV